jgi:nucleotide-binding universal stress UspA family protein
MMRVLVPVGESGNAECALRHVLKRFPKDSVEIHLLNVQPSFSRHITQFVSRQNRDSWRQEQGEEILCEGRRILEQLGVPHRVHIRVGSKAETIADEAHRLGCALIVMTMAKKHWITRVLENSVVYRVLELTTVPVELIPGDAATPWDRYSMPAGLVAIVTYLVLTELD